MEKASTQLSTKFGIATCNVYKENGKEHAALIFPYTSNAPLVRIHSECLTGDVFHSLHCDCKQQLDKSLAIISKEGGVILYLRQEGRGIGLLHKIQAYNMQQHGMDTYQANIQLGFKEDERDYEVAYDILRDLEISTLTLLTNNPKKVIALEQKGLEVTQQPLTTNILPEQKTYMKSKKEANHTISIPDDHIIFMQKAIEEGKKATSAHPNPQVGCVLVRNHKVISAGHTQPPGQPHAERMAMNQIDNFDGVTLYSTLEPCCHTGRTSPCTDAIIETGIKKVVIGYKDPDIRVNGKGIKQLKEAGIQVIILEDENIRSQIEDLKRDFFFRVGAQRNHDLQEK